MSGGETVSGRRNGVREKRCQEPFFSFPLGKSVSGEKGEKGSSNFFVQE